MTTVGPDSGPSNVVATIDIRLTEVIAAKEYLIHESETVMRGRRRTRHMIQRLAVGATAATLMLMLGACSQRTVGTGTRVVSATTPSGSPSGGTPRPSSSPPSSSSSSLSPVQLKAKLSTIVLQATDLPPGWDGAPYEADPTDDSNQQAVIACAGGKDTTANQLAEVHSDDYSLADGEISSQAIGFDSVAAADDYVAVFTSPKFATCYDQVLRSSVSSDTTIGSTAIAFSSRSSSDPAEVAAVGHGTFELTSGGQTVKVFLDVIFMKANSIESEVDFTNIGSAVPVTVRTPIIAAIAKRTSAA